MADARDFIAGSSSLVRGADSYTTPTEVGETFYVMGQNIVCRGGIIQTRPGSRSLFCLPDGNFQGMTLFTPDNGIAQIVSAVDGKIYVSSAPFTSYRRLWNLQFSPTAKYIAWCNTLKSTDYTLDGELYALDDPYSVLIIQDGLTRAAFWDGGTSAHINPAPAPGGTDVATQGYQGTPIGLWMIWAGNRLWVSSGNQIFASDIGNPVKFTEAQYLNEGRAFYLSGPCTGFISTPEQQGIIAFTENDGTYFQSSIQERTQWLNTPEFQKIILPNIGCIAPRSLITQYGLNWWFSPRGLTNFNAALRLNLSSRIDYQDNQMFSSKAYLGPDLSGVCSGFYENYMMVSVPSADVLNRHTWALDQAPKQDNANAWTGIWTGWRPIEWARGVVNGDERVFFGSIDYDGKNRIWEAMLPEKTDNGCAITCYAQLRDHAVGNLNQKKYDWSKFFLSQIYGDVDLNVYVASTKGSYQFQKSYHIVASPGQIFMDTEYSEAGPLMIGNTVQSRTIRTPSDPSNNDCNACGVESKEGNMIDYAFSHLLVWSGQMGLRAYQMYMRESPERFDGDCEEPEVSPRTLTVAGCSGLELLVDGGVFETFTAYAEGMTTTAYGGDVYIRREAVSVISQENAQALADCAVQQIIAKFHQSNIPEGVYDTVAAEIGGESYVVVSRPQDVTDDPDCPYFIQNPSAVEIEDGGNAVFYATAEGSLPITYQWQESTDGGATFGNIADGGVYSGATTQTLTITGATAGMDDYRYKCVAANACGEVFSSAAILTVGSSGLLGDILLIGGGGGGCSYGAGNMDVGGVGGGGGGGEVVEALAQALDPLETYTVTVGIGGVAVPGEVPDPATPSEFSGGAINLYAGEGEEGSGQPAPTGGGGGSGAGGEVSGGAGALNAGGGGGGAVGVGQDGNTLPGSGGDGGDGATLDSHWVDYGSFISDPEVGGGGGGATDGLGGGGAGASGGGGGAQTDDSSTEATNFGGGGGGGSQNFPDATSGYQGIVVVRYLGSPVFTGGTVDEYNGYTYHTFTEDGTLAPINWQDVEITYGENPITEGMEIDLGSAFSGAGCSPNIFVLISNPVGSGQVYFDPTSVVMDPVGVFTVTDVTLNPVEPDDFSVFGLNGTCPGPSDYSWSASISMLWYIDSIPHSLNFSFIGSVRSTP
jgi:hypothetical protein